MMPGDRSHVDVSVILAAVSGADHLSRLVVSAAASLGNRSCEFLVAADPDDRVLDDAARRLRLEGFVVRTVGRAEAAAANLALGYASGDVLVYVDRDLADQVERIPAIVDAVREHDAEVVVGSRYAEPTASGTRISLARGLKRRAASYLAAPFWSLRDPMAHSFAVARSVLERAPTLAAGGQTHLEVIVMAKCSRVVEVPLRYGQAHDEVVRDWRLPAAYLRQIKRLADHRFGGWSQLGQFCMVGVTGLVVDLIAYASLLGTSLDLPLARALSIFAAMSWTFTLNRRLSFSSQRFGRSIVSQYARYCAANGIGAAVNWSVAVALSTYTAYFGRHLMLAAMIGIALGAVINFTMARYWVFTPGGKASRSERLAQTTAS